MNSNSIVLTKPNMKVISQELNKLIPSVKAAMAKLGHKKLSKFKGGNYFHQEMETRCLLCREVFGIRTYPFMLQTYVQIYQFSGRKTIRRMIMMDTKIENWYQFPVLNREINDGQHVCSKFRSLL